MMLDIAEAFVLLREYYRAIVSDAENDSGKYSRSTDVGDFVPCSLTNVYQGLAQLLEEGLIDPTKPFFDAGSGDARVVALARLLGFPAYGMEYDALLKQEGDCHMESLERMALLNGVPWNILKGDFTKRDAYDILGVPFEEIGTFFNYVNNDDQLADCIAQWSPVGTKFIFYWGEENHPDYLGLTHVKKLELKDTSKAAILDWVQLGGWSEPEPVRRSVGWMHLYEKQAP